MGGIGPFLEISLASEKPGRTVARTWGISTQLFARYLGPFIETRPTVLYDLDAPQTLDALFASTIPGGRLWGGEENRALLSVGRSALDFLGSAQQADIDGFSFAVLERPPSDGETQLMTAGVADEGEIAAPVHLSLGYSDGAARFEAPTVVLDRVLSEALVERITGRQSGEAHLPGVISAARSTGVLMFRSMVKRGDVAHATILHASGFAGLSLAPPVKAGDVVKATSLEIGAAGPVLKPAGEKLIHEWLGVTRLGLWLSRGAVADDETAWA